MRVTFWGTRGSIAKAGPSTVRYGGNTSCVEVETDSGTSIVIDCGTGAHGLGHDLIARAEGAPINGHLLISHTHWDHIQGLPFFAPLFMPGSEWKIYGPRGLGNSLLDTLAGQMQYSYFPITLEQLAAQVEYHDLVEGTFTIDDACVTTHYLNHPALTLGYRLTVDGATVVYASDHEPHRSTLAGGGDLSSSRQDMAHLDFLHGADLVIHDAQYLADEYEGKAGWGHSTVEYVVAAAHQASAKRVALYHHDPARDDAAVDGVLELARAHARDAGYEGDVIAAAEGLQIELNGDLDAPRITGLQAATRKPALDDVGRSVLIAVRNPDIADIVRSAARDEELQIWETRDTATALELARTKHPAIVFLEADDEVVDQAKDIRDIDDDYGRDVTIVTVARSDAMHRTERPSIITDWLFWPFSSFLLRTKIHAALLRRACRWQNAPLPADEEKRLESLRRLEILDTEPEARFDRLTRRAGELLDVPIAIVSLVDEDRQWFKSIRGLDVAETPRDAAFCSHAIHGTEVFQVPDALVDPRFADNPVVSGDPRIRFYAGAPLSLSDGSAVGTLCVIDYRPRVLDEAQIGELRRLADEVVEELEATGSVASG